ncbi:MAG TPA: 1-acyl-sn-glycerol-3-phosphate acyltransferase [Bacteroidales bacterium]|nr:1-acyl-sn-glycerol-3-phosphate acyltransferase [Bacteroidales bacterium]
MAGACRELAEQAIVSREMTMAVEKIDIEAAIRSSKSKFIRSMPHFMISLIRKLIRQDEMNATLEKTGMNKGIDFVNAVLREWNIDVIIRGGENIPASGRFVFVANHPVGAMDSLAFLSMIAKYFPDVVSPSNELFGYLPQLDPLILGVNVFGKNTKETAGKLNRLFGSSTQIMIFPSGEVSRRKNGKIEDPDWQKSFITKAVEHHRDIIPVHISGRNSGLFYFVANLRKLLGIGMYVETVLLPREMMNQRGKPVILTVGKPIPWQTITTDKSHHEWAGAVKRIVYKISG